MVDIAVLFGAKREVAKKELLESLQFEIKLANVRIETCIDKLRIFATNEILNFFLIQSSLRDSIFTNNLARRIIKNCYSNNEELLF